MTWMRNTAAALVACGATLAAPPIANATYPGRDGVIAFFSTDRPLGIWKVAPSGRVAPLLPERCPILVRGRPTELWSPDGTTLAVAGQGCDGHAALFLATRAVGASARSTSRRSRPGSSCRPVPCSRRTAGRCCSPPIRPAPSSPRSSASRGRHRAHPGHRDTRRRRGGRRRPGRLARAHHDVAVRRAPGDDAGGRQRRRSCDAARVRLRRRRRLVARRDAPPVHRTRRSSDPLQLFTVGPGWASSGRAGGGDTRRVLAGRPADLFVADDALFTMSVDGSDVTSLGLSGCCPSWQPR